MRLCASILLIALACWLAVITAAGATAIASFTGLPRLGITVPQVQPFFGQDTAEMGRWAAGHVLQPVFVVGDWVQYVMAALAVGCTARMVRTRGYAGARWAAMTLLLVVAASAAILAWRAWSMPAMTEDLLAYWNAVEQNDAATAAAARLRFDAAHHAAETGLNAQFVLVLLALPLAVLTLVPGRLAAPRTQDQFRG